MWSVSYASNQVCLGTWALESRMILTRCELDEVIYHSRTQAQYWYRVVAGAFRKYSSTMDGRRRTVDFPLPDDVFGFVAHNLCRPMSRYNIADELAMAVDTVSRVLILLRITRHRVPQHASFQYLRPPCTRARNSAY
jgi:hypothetical protein